VTALLPEEAEQDPAVTRVLALVPEKGPQAEDIDLDVAVVVWNAGHNSVSKLRRNVQAHQTIRRKSLRKMILAHGDARAFLRDKSSTL